MRPWQSALLFLFAGIVGVCALALIADALWCSYQKRRERNSMRVRDEDRYALIAPYEPAARQRRL